MTKIGTIRAICESLSSAGKDELCEAFLQMVGKTQDTMRYHQREEQEVYDILQRKNAPMRCTEISLETDGYSCQHTRGILSRLMESGRVQRTEGEIETLMVHICGDKYKKIESPIVYFSVKV